MTEKEFWVFFEKSLIKNRVPQLFSCMDNGNKITKNIVVEMGELIMVPRVPLRAKEIMLMTLAHHPSKEALQALTRYNKNPDKGLEHTARFALEECEWWNE
ncbi:MAG: hypothetical protein Q8R05_03635 [Candidatus Omnitrophota bacterium]|nr:hypothetical protein [Candidatus Omnitrophota bacterium]